MAMQSTALTDALEAALEHVPPSSRGGALAALARAYTEAIDAAPDRAATLAALGPKLQAALTALGLASATPVPSSAIPADGRLTLDAPPASGLPAPTDAASVLGALRSDELARRRGVRAG